MKKKMALALITSMTIAAGAGSVVVQAAPKEAKLESTRVNAEAKFMNLMDKDIYYMGVGENDESVILGASEDWSDYEAIITGVGSLLIVSEGDEDAQAKKESTDNVGGTSVEVSENKESVTITLPDGTTLTAERSDLVKSLVELIGVIDTFDSAVERGELDAE